MCILPNVNTIHPSTTKEADMSDMDLLDFMVRQYQTQSKMANALKLSDGAISKWRSRGELPNAWRMYFNVQFFKKGEQNV